MMEAIRAELLVGPAGVVVARLTCTNKVNEKVTSSILVWGNILFITSFAQVSSLIP